LIDEEQRLEAEEEYELYCGWWWNANTWAKNVLNGPGQAMLNEYFGKTKPLPKPGGTIKFKRYGNFKAEPVSHMHDALSYTMTMETYNESKAIPKEAWEAAGKNPHSKTD
jgi:hypothetical protein